MDDFRFQDAIKAEAEAMRCAREALGVDEGASPEEIRRAWRKACIETHPDRNPGDLDAERRFRMINCAYRLLIDGTPCDELPTPDLAPDGPASHSKYDLNTAWGRFLWWRDKFF